MTRKTRSTTAAAIGLCCLALDAAGCAGGGDDGAGGGAATVTVWTNAMEGRGLVFWQNAAKEYKKLHPDVTIKIQSVQNEDLADVVGQEALALHKAEAEARYKPAAEEPRAGQVIDLTAHDETEHIDVQGLRSAVS